MEELFTFVIFVVVGIVQLVKFLNKQQEKAGGGGYSSSSRPYSGTSSSQSTRQASSAKSLLSEALKEIQRPQQAETKKVSNRIENVVQESYNVKPAPQRKGLSKVPKSRSAHGENRFARTIRSKRQLQDAFIMKEILDRPVSDRM